MQCVDKCLEYLRQAMRISIKFIQHLIRLNSFAFVSNMFDIEGFTAVAPPGADFPAHQRGEDPIRCGGPEAREKWLRLWKGKSGMVWKNEVRLRDGFALSLHISHYAIY